MSVINLSLQAKLHTRLPAVCCFCRKNFTPFAAKQETAYGRLDRARQFLFSLTGCRLPFGVVWPSMGKAHGGAALQPVGLSGASSSTLAAASDDVHLYFMAGQSNMVGFGNGSALSAELMARLQDLSRPGDPAAPITYYAATHAGGASTSYGRTSCVMNSERDQRVLDRSSPDFQKVERLPFAPVTACEWERVVYDLPSRFGPELAFGLALHEQWPSQQFVLSKRAVCGASMADDWNPGVAGHDGLDARRSSGYGALLEDLAEVRRAFSPRSVVPAGLIWLQGEADSTNEAQAMAYRSNLFTFITQLREDTGEPELPVVLVGLSGPPLSAPRKYEDHVDEAFRDAAQGLHNVAFLRNDAGQSSREHLPIGKEGGVTRRGETEFPRMLGELNAAGELDRSLGIGQRRALRNNVCAHYMARAQIRIGARAAASLAEMNGQAPASWPWVKGVGDHHAWRTAPDSELRQGDIISARRSNPTRARALRAAEAEVRMRVAESRGSSLHLEAAAEPPLGTSQRAADKRAADERRAAAKRAHDARRGREYPTPGTERAPDGAADADDTSVAAVVPAADDTATAGLSEPKVTCHGVTEAMNSWCVANCAMGVCPPDKCSCEDDESAPAAAPAVDDASGAADAAVAADATAADAVAAADDAYADAVAAAAAVSDAAADGTDGTDDADATDAAAAATAAAVADAAAATDAAIASNAATAAAMADSAAAAASGDGNLGNLGQPLGENHPPPGEAKSLDDWFWEMEGKYLLENLPGDNSVDSKHSCRSA